MLSLDEKLKGKKLFLTNSQRKLLDYILAHDEESIFLNVEDLATKVNVSEATVVRLPRALGFEGFSEFQKHLRFLFRKKLTTTSRLQKTVEKVSKEEDVLIKILQTDIYNIEQTLKQTPAKEFQHFVEYIDSADRILIVGLRSAYSLAVFLGIVLEFLQRNVWVIQPGIGDMWDRLLGLKKGDLVIGISFPRYAKQTVEVLQFAKKKGVKTLAITDSLISPLAECSDHVLTAHYKIDSFVESFTASFSLCNAIVTALGVFSKKGPMRSLKELENIWEIHQVYFSTIKSKK